MAQGRVPSRVQFTAFKSSCYPASHHRLLLVDTSHPVPYPLPARRPCPCPAFSAAFPAVTGEQTPCRNTGDGIKTLRLAALRQTQFREAEAPIRGDGAASDSDPHGHLISQKPPLSAPLCPPFTPY